MRTNLKLISAPESTAWTKRCRLEIPFCFARRSAPWGSDYLKEKEAGTGRSLEHFAPKRRRDFFPHPSTMLSSLGFNPAAKGSAPSRTPPFSLRVLSV